MKNIWKVLLSVALNHSPLQQSLTANFTKHPPEQADYINERGWPGLCANSSNRHESVFTRHHTEDTNCWCCFFFFFFLTILYRRINTTTEWRSLWKCDIFSAVNFLMQVPVSSLHYTFPLYFILRKSAPLLRKKKKVLVTTQQSSKRFTWKLIPEESHSVRTWGYNITSPREDPLSTDFELIFNWPSLNNALKTTLTECEGRFELHPHVYRRPFENQERRTLRISTDTQYCI